MYDNVNLENVARKDFSKPEGVSPKNNNLFMAESKTKKKKKDGLLSGHGTSSSINSNKGPKVQNKYQQMVKQTQGATLDDTLGKNLEMYAQYSQHMGHQGRSQAIANFVKGQGPSQNFGKAKAVKQQPQSFGLVGQPDDQYNYAINLPSDQVYSSSNLQSFNH